MWQYSCWYSHEEQLRLVASADCSLNYVALVGAADCQPRGPAGWSRLPAERAHLMLLARRWQSRCGSYGSGAGQACTRSWGVCCQYVENTCALIHYQVNSGGSVLAWFITVLSNLWAIGHVQLKINLVLNTPSYIGDWQIIIIAISWSIASSYKIYTR